MKKICPLLRASCLTYTLAGQVERGITSSATLGTRSWRVKAGLPINKNAEGPLTDGPDYTFLDGRPTPLLAKQRKRMLQQQEFAASIVQLSSEIDFAINRFNENTRKAEESKQQYIQSKLKPKGSNFKA